MPDPAVAASTLYEGTSTTLAGAKPTGTVAGSALAAFVWIGGGEAITAVPTDWDLEATLTVGSGGGQHFVEVYTHEAGGSEPSTYDWTKSGGGNRSAVVVVRLTDVDVTDFLASSLAQPGTRVDGTHVDSPDTTTDTDHALVFRLIGEVSFNQPTFSLPAGATVVSQTTTSGARFAVGVEDTNVSPAGATGTRQWTASQFVGVGEVAAGTIAFKPAAASSAVGKSLAPAYDVIGIVGKSVAPPYHVRGAAGASRELDYGILGASSATVEFDSVTTGTNIGSGFTTTVLHTAAGANRVAVVSVADYNAPTKVTGVTYDGVAMTLVPGSKMEASAPSASMWYLVAPSLTTNAPVVVSTSAVSTVDVSVVTWKNANPANPLGSVVSSSPTAATDALNVPIPANGAGMDHAVQGGYGSAATSPNRTSTWNIVAGATESAGQRTVSATTQTLSFSWTYVAAPWKHQAVPINPSAAAVGKSLAVPAHVLGALGKPVALPYAVTGQVGNTVALPSHVLQGVAPTLTLLYDVESASVVVKRLAVAYHVINLAGRTVALPSHVRTSAGLSRALLYDVRSAAGQTVALPYGLSGTLGVPLAIVFDVLTGVTFEVDETYRLLRAGSFSIGYGVADHTYSHSGVERYIGTTDRELAAALRHFARENPGILTEV